MPHDEWAALEKRAARLARGAQDEPLTADEIQQLLQEIYVHKQMVDQFVAAARRRASRP